MPDQSMWKDNIFILVCGTGEFILYSSLLLHPSAMASYLSAIHGGRAYISIFRILGAISGDFDDECQKFGLFLPPSSYILHLLPARTCQAGDVEGWNRLWGKHAHIYTNPNPNPVGMMI